MWFLPKVHTFRFPFRSFLVSFSHICSGCAHRRRTGTTVASRAHTLSVCRFSDVISDSVSSDSVISFTASRPGKLPVPGSEAVRLRHSMQPHGCLHCTLDHPCSFIRDSCFAAERKGRAPALLCYRARDGNWMDVWWLNMACESQTLTSAVLLYLVVFVIESGTSHMPGKLLHHWAIPEPQTLLWLYFHSPRTVDGVEES